jgi:hypothetical protein
MEYNVKSPFEGGKGDVTWRVRLFIKAPLPGGTALLKSEIFNCMVNKM